jgi:hypothetical protein
MLIFPGLPLSPSWADEFLVPIFKKFPDKVIFKKDESMPITLVTDILEEVHGIKFNWE